MPMPPRNVVISPVSRAHALRKNQHREAVAGDLADVAQRLPRAGFALRQRKRVEEERREVVVQPLAEHLAPRLTFREEVRLEELLRHRRRDGLADVAGHRREDDRHVEVALVIGGEDDRAVEIASRCSRPLTRIQANTRASGRIQVAWLSRRITPTTGWRFQLREVDRLGDVGLRRAPRSSSARTSRDRLRRGELRFVDARLQPVFERHHQLDALERAQPEILERRVGADRAAAGESREQRRDRIVAASTPRPAARRVATQSRIACALQLPACPRCAAARRSSRPRSCGSR